MKLTKWLDRKKVDPINVLPGDSIQILSDGKPLLTRAITKTMVVTEVGLFEAEVEGRAAIGGVFIE